MMDGPVIDYGSKKGMGNSAADVREMEDLAEAYAKRREKEGSVVGKTVNLDEFTRSKV